MGTRKLLPLQTLYLFVIFCVVLSIFVYITHVNHVFLYGSGSMLLNVKLEVSNLHIDKTPSVIWEDTPGNFTERIKYYNLLLEKLRYKLWKTRGAKPWQNPNINNELQLIDPVRPLYIRNVTKRKDVITVFLKRLPLRTNSAYWSSKNDYENLLIQRYHNWAVDSQVCEWVKIKGLNPDGWTYTPKCLSEISAVLSTSSLDVKLLNIYEDYANIYNEWYKPMLDIPPPYVTYVHIVQDAVISELGEIYSGNLKLSPYPCTFKGHVIIRSDAYDDVIIHPEVFSVAQIYGRQVYHRNIDQIPRIAPYLHFLLKYPEIKIHIGVDHSGTTNELLELLGIPYSRVLREVTRAKVVYVPEGTPCGMINIPNTQILSSVYSKVIQETSPGLNIRDSVVFVNRTGKRHLVDNTLIYTIVKQFAGRYNLTVAVFGDDPAPGIPETMRMFNKAVMVIAPHGAGLYNIIYCQPKTFVLEILLPIPWLIMCFQRLSHVLGHHYYGLLGSDTYNTKVDIGHFNRTLEYLMHHAAKLSYK